MRRPPSLLLRAGVVTLLLLAACNRDQDPNIDASGTISTSTSTTVVLSSAEGDPSPPVSSPAGKERGYLTGVRVDTKDGGASRVVFEFDPILPGYKLDFVDRPVTMDGSGAEVKVGGEAVLGVTMENAAQARFEGEKVILTYPGLRRLKPTGAGAETASVVEVVEAGDFEGTVHWVIGLRQKDAKVSVSRLTDPNRLVLDFSPA
ncbi:MAG TPA: hypothetical protein VMZ51_07055 [Acidimicrobiales bacterium]|nr:hypothetical protein [Acidimicrobiales bacterium]